MLAALLFNSSARMYNLRILLLTTAGALIPTTVTSIPEVDSDPSDSDAWAAWLSFYVTGLGSSCLILTHHILRGNMQYGPLGFFEYSPLISFAPVVAYLTDFSIENYTWSSSSIMPSLILVARPIQLTALLISLIWSTATIMNSPQKITHQYFEFLGGCSQPRGPYTPLRILTNRSASKPLVRGEFRGIAIIRAITLSILCIALATLGVYTIIVVPMNAQVFKGQVLPNVVPLLKESVNIGPNLGIIVCGQFAGNDGYDNTGRAYLDVKLGQGDFNDISRYTEMVGLMPSAHLFATLTWTQQQLKTSAFALGGLTPSKTILISEFNTVQGDTRYGSNMTWDPSLALPDSTLSIFQPQVKPVKFVQQYTETSALNGLATMGGFWTFVNGAFALFFGANVMYFLLGGHYSVQ
ncbi:hypothetical protein C8R45DRAFT_933307 [Mycena sanguinolenta]|nr:hypothetical protein C8R45DRAFT_933307 [Mycena sanguinolenta]